jgi:predicted nucleic acid-binding protein
MTSVTLVDTNVLVYSTGVDGLEKAAAADAALMPLLNNESGVLSTQVLSEYANVMLRRYPRPAHPVVVRELDVLRETWTVLLVTDEVIIEAIRGTIEHGMSFYDAQLWATARLAGVEVVLTEDFTDGRVVEGVRFVDPFSPSFDPQHPPF